MPRPFPTRTLPGCLAAAICCAALGPAALHAALAGAAGTLFEAAPFVLVAEALPARAGWRLLTSIAGCGCGRAGAGALSLTAFGLCWLAFGPWPALARTAVGVAFLFYYRSRPGVAHGGRTDPFDELLRLAPSAAAAAVLSGFVTRYAPAADTSPAGQAIAFFAGLALGCVAPCATAAVAIAAAFAPHLASAAAGVLTTGGLVAPLRHRIVARRVDGGTSRGDAGRRTTVARLAVALALAVLARGGPRGFVNPRLLPFEGGAALLALAGIRRTSRAAGALAVPGVMLVALAAGSPVPSYVANETRLGDAFAGEALVFTGVAHRAGASTVVQRFAITCCRVDASAVAVRTTTPLAVPEGSWIRARGSLVESPGGLLLRADDWQRIASPSDPFVYR